MHPSAYRNCQRFVQRYLSPPGEVLDVGSFDVNGSLKPLFDSGGWQYVGVDLRPGPNVDVVIEAGCTGRSRRLPFADKSFDAVVCSSCLEHDPVFWVTFWEMVRVTKAGGMVYLCVPSEGPYHAHPVDCWRFQADCWGGLASWCPRAELVESYVSGADPLWKDNVGIFRVN